MGHRLRAPAAPALESGAAERPRARARCDTADPHPGRGAARRGAAAQPAAPASGGPPACRSGVASVVAAVRGGHPLPAAGARDGRPRTRSRQDRPPGASALGRHAPTDARAGRGPGPPRVVGRARWTTRRRRDAGHAEHRSGGPPPTRARRARRGGRDGRRPDRGAGPRRAALPGAAERPRRGLPAVRGPAAADGRRRHERRMGRHPRGARPRHPARGRRRRPGQARGGRAGRLIGRRRGSADRSADPTAIRAAFERVTTDSSFATAAQRIAGELAAAGGVPRAVQLLESLLVR